MLPDDPRVRGHPVALPSQAMGDDSAERDRASGREVPDLAINGQGLVALATALLGAGAALRFRARGSSMEPFILDGDVLTVEPATIAAVRVGDVILHKLGPGAPVAHRVLKKICKAGACFALARGDAQRAHLDRVASADLLGRIVLAEREGKGLLSCWVAGRPSPGS